MAAQTIVSANSVSMRNFGLKGLLSFGIFSAHSGATENVEPRSLVIGGDDAGTERFQYAHVSVPFAGGDEHMCGATLVAADFVLTAAHCLDTDVGRIQVGRYDFADAAEQYETYEAAEIFVHPNFDLATFQSDFGLIQLDDTVDSITPTMLNSNSSIPETSQLAYVFGWGSINADNENPIYPDKLQLGNVSVMSNKDCRRYGDPDTGQLVYGEEISADMLCAEASHADACIGDSGSPLVILSTNSHPEMQIGIVSWGRGCNIHPGVYSRVSIAYPWVRSIICSRSRSPPDYFRCQNQQRPTANPALPPSLGNVNDRQNDRTSIVPDNGNGTRTSDSVHPWSLKHLALIWLLSGMVNRWTIK